MADPNDKSLLDRLNALKPTSVVLGTANNALDVSTTGIQPAEPLSREDALSKRLRTLRNQREKAPQDNIEDPPPPYTEAREGESSSFTQPPLGPPTPATQNREQAIPMSQSAANDRDQDRDDHLDEDEDRTLDEILDSLVIEDDHWSVSDDEDAGDSKQVEELLANLRRDPDVKLLPSPPGKRPGDQTKNEKEHHNDPDDDDNSEGDDISREVDIVLSRTMDELKLDPSSTDQPASRLGKEPDGDASDPEISLPTVPQDTATPTSTTINDDHLPELPTTPHHLDTTTGAAADPGLSLPTVPTALIDPAPSNTTADPFESSIANRLAALKGPGHKPLSTDAFGLPSVPTAPPTEDPSAAAAAPGGFSSRTKAGYTDADQKTWCVVCLEDATVRCLDCDGGDVYCARCWREMHVGPAAGYDERGHSWVKFDARRG